MIIGQANTVPNTRDCYTFYKSYVIADCIVNNMLKDSHAFQTKLTKKTSTECTTQNNCRKNGN